MRLKKLMSVSLCMTMVLSLAGCTFNPKDTISNILNGKGDSTSNANIVASAEKVNKDAVFKEGKTIYFDGFDYIDGLKSANGKYYAARIKYGDYEGDYSDGPVLYDVEEIEEEIEEDIEEDIEEEIPLVVDEKEPVDVDSEDVDNVNFEYEDDYYDGEYYEGDSKMTFTLASFTNADDVEYRSFEIDGGEEYFSGGNWGIDKEEKLYAVVASYDPMTYDESYKIRKYSLDGTVLKEVNVDSNNEQSFYVRYFFVDSEGNAYFLSEQSVTVFDKELNKKYYYKTDIKEGYLSTAKLNDKGELIFSVVSWENDKYSSKTFKMDDKGNVAEDTSLNDIIAEKSLVEGNGYDFYYSTNSSIMGINVGDKAATEVVNFYDSDINPGDFYGTIYFASAEEFLMTVQDENGAGLTFYEKVPAEEVKDKEIITLGTVYGSYYISSQIINYNKNNDNYRIKLVDYSELNSADDWDAGRKRFYTDISGGNAPDIIVPEAYDVTNLIDKGVFTDLTPLMENSDGVKKEDLVYNARTIFAKDDKLYCVFPSFTVEAMQIKKEFYKEGMTLDDVIEWEKATGNKALSGQMERDGVMSMIMSMSMNEFLDPKTGKCSFDSPEFAKLLEYANTYPESLPDDYWENYDFEQYMYEFRKNTALLNFAYVDDFSSYNWNAKYRFGEIPELIGVPLSGNDTAVLNIDTVIGISNKSKHKEAAWDFIKTCFEHEYYEELGWGIPSVEKELDLMAEKATEPYYYFDENGEKVYEEQKYFLIDHEEVITPLTKEEAAKLKDFIVHVEGLYTWDEELNNIIDEETDGYFAGQKSADEVASIIQSRLKIYINEKR